MLASRLSLFLVVTLIVPIAQVVNPQRDVNAEENVAVSFVQVRRQAGLPAVKRTEGTTLARAACQAAAHGSRDRIWVESTNYAAVLYSSAQPELADAITQLAMRSWPSDRRLEIGACSASTPAVPSGQDWVVLGLVDPAAERHVAGLLGGNLQSNATQSKIR